MKILITKISASFAITTLLLGACNQPVMQPQAEIGWNGNQQIVRVTDDSGQQFLISYLLYRQLFSSGGYNNVVHYYYYADPNARGLYRSNTVFSRGKPLTNFISSYRSMAVKKSVYRPTSLNVSRARRSATYIRAAKVYSSKPSIRFKSSARTFYSPSRSTYRSSYRSSSRSGRR